MRWTFSSLCSYCSLHIENFVHSSYRITFYFLFIRCCLRICPMRLLEYHFQNQCAGTLRYAKFVLNWCGLLILVWMRRKTSLTTMLLCHWYHYVFIYLSIVLSKWLFSGHSPFPKSSLPSLRNILYQCTFFTTWCASWCGI